MSTIPATAGNTIELSAATDLTGVPFGPGPESGDRPKTFGIVRVGTDVDALVVQHGAVVACRQIGGARNGWQAVARIALTVYAPTYSAAWDAHAALSDHLIGGTYRRTNGGVRFDSWRTESDGVEQPYPGALAVVASVWRATTRDI